jgi:hypothetical protein
MPAAGRRGLEVCDILGIPDGGEVSLKRRQRSTPERFSFLPVVHILC